MRSMTKKNSNPNPPAEYSQIRYNNLEYYPLILRSAYVPID
jgi:hypothetical protein